jgi:hypothetical protein
MPHESADVTTPDRAVARRRVVAIVVLALSVLINGAVVTAIHVVKPPALSEVRR